MKIGSLDVETVAIPASTYMRVSRLTCDPSCRTFALLGLALKSPPIVAPSLRDALAVEAFGEAVLDHFIDQGCTFSHVTDAASAVVLDVSNRLGFTKPEVEADADFSEATEVGS
jgi:hypothetical protein